METIEQGGELISEDGHIALRFERQLRCPIQKVWQAITESHMLPNWFPADLQGVRAAGERIRIVSFAGRFAPAEGRFIVFEPGRMLEYTWGKETLRWGLRATENGCVLVFVNVLDDQATAIGASDIAAAWHACLDVLGFVLANETAPYTADERFDQLSEAYARDFEQKRA